MERADRVEQVGSSDVKGFLPNEPKSRNAYRPVGMMDSRESRVGPEPKRTQVKPNQTQSNPIKPGQTTFYPQSNLIRLNQTKSNQIKPNQTEKKSDRRSLRNVTYIYIGVQVLRDRGVLHYSERGRWRLR